MPVGGREELSAGAEDSTLPRRPDEECTATEEYAAVPESFFSSPALPSFHQKKHDLFQRLQVLAAQCRERYSNRKELAAEEDKSVGDLCETLDIAFQYGLKQQQQPNFVVSAASLFQNMQEIVTGISSSKTSNTDNPPINFYFWDYCQIFLTAHEKQRFEQLQQIWTKWGKGRSFVRASLNEHSLHRYLQTWLSDKKTLDKYYSHWSLMADENMGISLVQIIKSLDNILFALAVDRTELNAALKFNEQKQLAVKEEPLIYAPAPVKVESKSKKPTIVERPIATRNSTEDLLESLCKDVYVDTGIQKSSLHSEQENVNVILPIEEISAPPDPIEPELEFLKQPLYDYADSISSSNSCNDIASADVASETSSRCSRNSSIKPLADAECHKEEHIMLEQQLKETTERCSLLETRVAQLSLENRQLIRRLKQHFEDSGIDPSSSFATNFLITIPHVRLHKPKHGASYHMYDVHITMRQNLEHWSLWRRYSDFNKLHKCLLKTHPSVKNIEFPRKKRFGNMNETFVEERRQQLQIYLLNLVETLPQLESCKSKMELQKVFPFLRER